ncbi:MAG: hypothetical protein VB018_01980 [Lachnospiraceae bacterium]|nr:hypothetical protein [Lachnospiraceae bacterium]
MKKLIPIFLIFSLCGCNNSAKLMELADNNLNAPSFSTCDIYIENSTKTPPLAGFSITNSSLYTTIETLERNTTANTIYGFEMTTADTFPISDVLHCFILNKTPLITLTADNGFFPTDNRLISLAQSFGTLNIPIYLNLFPFGSRLYANTHTYTQQWNNAAKIFRKNAPNVTLVWSMPSDDVRYSIDFCPDTECFDIIGLSHYQNPEDSEDSLFSALEYLCFYTDKDIFVTSMGLSHYSTANHSYTTAQAAENLINIYTGLVKNYPQVKAALYTDVDFSVGSPSSVQCNDYRITTEPALITAYNKAVKAFTSPPPPFVKSQFSGLIANDKAYAHRSLFMELFGDIPDMAEVNFYDENYISLENLITHTVEIRNNNIYLEKIESPAAKSQSSN